MDGRTPGSVVVLNGVSRAGKTSIAEAVQAIFDGVWMNLGMDAHIRATPARYRPGVGLRPQRPEWIRESPGRVPVLSLEDWIPDLYVALYGSVAAHARLGLNVVMDVAHHDAYSRSLDILPRCARELAGFPALFVGVRCPIDVIWERRKTTWGQDRDEVDESVVASTQLAQEAVHAHDYDLEVDTSTSSAAECAKLIRRRLENGPPGTCFSRLARS